MAVTSFRSDELQQQPRGRADLDLVIERQISSVYQPIVHLDTGRVIAYEALVRGPRDSPFESPGALFAAAAEHGRVAELDQACRAAAVRGALGSALRRPPCALFINIEPASIGRGVDDSLPQLRAARRQLSIFFEITERALTSDPARLLNSVERMRSDGFGIALDDVGADRRSLALLPLLRPDVVKLDMSLIHNHPSRESGEVMNGVCAYAEQTGAAILAEGIETEQHLLAARSLGAGLAQGWYFGRPGPLPAEPDRGRSPIRLGLAPRTSPRSPVALVDPRRGLTVGRKDVLLSITRALEAKALEQGQHAVVAATFQHVDHFTASTRRRYERLADRASLVVALGVGMPVEPVSGVHGARITADDPLVGEWDIAVLGPHYAGALVARDLGDEVREAERRFEFVLTFDRELVTEVAASLISRVE